LVENHIAHKSGFRVIALGNIYEVWIWNLILGFNDCFGDAQ